MSTSYTNTYPATGYASESQLRAEFDKIKVALEQSVSKSGAGTGGNAMTADLPMNGMNITNAGDITFDDGAGGTNSLEAHVVALTPAVTPALIALQANVVDLHHETEVNTLAVQTQVGLANKDATATVAAFDATVIEAANAVTSAAAADASAIAAKAAEDAAVAINLAGAGTIIFANAGTADDEVKVNSENDSTFVPYAVTTTDMNLLGNCFFSLDGSEANRPAQFGPAIGYSILNPDGTGAQYYIDTSNRSEHRRVATSLNNWGSWNAVPITGTDSDEHRDNGASDTFYDARYSKMPVSGLTSTSHVIGSLCFASASGSGIGAISYGNTKVLSAGVYELNTTNHDGWEGSIINSGTWMCLGNGQVSSLRVGATLWQRIA